MSFKVIASEFIPCHFWKKMKDSTMPMPNPYSGQGKREDQTLWTFDWCQDWGASISIIQ